MATSASQPLKISLEASAALATAVAAQNAGSGNAQYCFVKRDTSGYATLCSAATDTPIGVLQNKPLAKGQMCEIVVVGITKVVTTSAGTAFTTFNDGVAPYTDGTAQKGTATGFGASYVQGTKSVVGRLAPIGGTVGPGLPAAGDVTRIAIDCTVPATPGT